jgi:predicted acyltransferase
MLAAPLVLYFQWRAQLLWFAGLLLGYTVVQLYIPVPDAMGVWHTGSLQPGEDVGAWLDRSLLGGHLWRASKTWDPEGLLSSLPAVASQIAGVLAGHWLANRRDPVERTAWMLIAGLALLWAGQVLGAWSIPVNKSLWSPAYVLFMAGWSCVVFAVFYWALDAMPHIELRRTTAVLLQPLVIFGMNALFLFALSGLIAKMLGFVKVADDVSLKAWLFAPIAQSGLEPVNASLAFALLFTGFLYVIAWAMWRKRWFVKV